MHESLILFTAIAVLAIPAVAIAAIVLAIKAGSRHEELARRVDNLSREVRHLRARHADEFGPDPSRAATQAGEVAGGGGEMGESGAMPGVEEGRVAAARGEEFSPRTPSEAAPGEPAEKRAYSFSFLDSEDFSPEYGEEPSAVVGFLKRVQLYPPDAKECGTAGLRAWWMKRAGIPAGVIALFFVATVLSRSVSPWLGVGVILGAVAGAGGYVYQRTRDRGEERGESGASSPSANGRLSKNEETAHARAEQGELFVRSKEDSRGSGKKSRQAGKAKKRGGKQGRRQKRGR